MQGKKVGLVGIVLLILAVAGWHNLNVSPVEKLRQKYGVQVDTQSNDVVLSGRLSSELLVSNGVALGDAKLDAVSEPDDSTPSRENRWVVANTSMDLDSLVRCDSAVLLRNAHLDTRNALSLPIPDYLKASENPGCYIVQSSEPITESFYERLTAAGVSVISYVPNNAVLVAMSSEQAKSLEAEMAAVLPYHPYYKLDTTLLEVALMENEEPYHAGTVVQVALTPGLEDDFAKMAKADGLTILSRAETQFGDVVMVQPSSEQVVTLAQAPSVHLMGVCHPRAFANDLTLPRLNVTTNLSNTETYLGLTGKGFINVNDSMINTNHPALSGRVFFAEDGDGHAILPENRTDMVHGTHVLGTILGDGAESASAIEGAIGSVGTTNLSFRGVATNASALYLPINNGALEAGVDLNIIRWAAQTNYLTKKRENVLISNNSWNFSDQPEYDLSASVYDAAVRDALTDVTGMQPMLFVFSAGNQGEGDTSGTSGKSDSIMSPATAKNVITVGALESARHVDVPHTNYTYVTNVVNDTSVVTTNITITTNASLYEASDDEQQVANYSSRGNVGVGVEGTYGRLKPDIVAPGSFVISTRGSTDADEVPDTYEKTTIIKDQFLGAVLSGETEYNNYAFFAPTNIVGLTIEIVPNASSPEPFPKLELRLKKGARPDEGDIVGSNNKYSTTFEFDPDAYDRAVKEKEEKESESKDEDDEESPIGSDYIDPTPYWSTGYGDWYYSIASGNVDVSFDIILTMELTYSQKEKDYFADLDTASERLGEYYRFQSGTSMAAAAVSGTLLLVQEFFETYAPAGVTNPSPALLKALLLNGSNPTGNRYSRREAYGVNYQGWGIPNLTNIVPEVLTNAADMDAWTLRFVEQSPTNALSTGEAWERSISVPQGMTEGNMKVTLVWTDPAANPSVATKLVNDLDLVVSNSVTKMVYVGNDFPVNTDYNSGYNFETETNSDDTLDTNSVSELNAALSRVDNARDRVNNVETVVIKGPLDTNYVLSVQARRVNVNAVTAHTNGIVQDFALVVSFQNMPIQVTSTNTNSFNFELKPTEEKENIQGTNVWLPPLSIVTNSVAMTKQRVGANSPLLGVNTNLTNGSLAQWHFYVFTNVWWKEYPVDTNTTPSDEDNDNPETEASADEDDEEKDEGDEDVDDDKEDVVRERVGGPNVAFATFTPPNLSMQKRLSYADVDMYVSTNYALTNLDAAVIAECVTNGWASLNQGGSELFYTTNAAENEVFYVGIKSEDQKAAEYNFVGISSKDPFTDYRDGSAIVNFNPNSVWVPDGSADEPGGIYMFGICTVTMDTESVVVTNIYNAQNAGDLFVSLRHEAVGEENEIVLHNHSFLTSDLNPVKTNEVQVVYDDSTYRKPWAQNSDGPGSLYDCINTEANGLWLMTLLDNALTHTNQVSASMCIYAKSQDTVYSVKPYDFVYKPFDVGDDVLAVKIIISEIDPETLPLDLYVLRGARPTLELYDYKDRVEGPGGVMIISREDIPALVSGRYWLGVYNPNNVTVNFKIDFEFIRGFVIGDDMGVPSERTPLELLDDAYTLSQVSHTNITVELPPTEEAGVPTVGTNEVEIVNDAVIHVKDDRLVEKVNVGIRLDHPRISDLSISLVSPSGTEVLLAENRGWDATNANPTELNQIPNEKNNSAYGTGISSTNSHGYTYAFFSSDTNYWLQPIKFAVPPFTNNGQGLPILTSSFEGLDKGVYSETNSVLTSDDFTWMLSAAMNTNRVWNEEEQRWDETTVPVRNFKTWLLSDTNEAYQDTNFIIASRTVLKTTISGLECNSNYVLRIPFKRPDPLKGLVTWWKAENDYMDAAWNLQLESAAGYNRVVFDTNGMVGNAFGLTNAYLFAKSPNILGTISSNFTVEGWFKVNQEDVQKYAVQFGGPTMPLFEFSQYSTNFWTNIVTVDGEEIEEVFDIVSLERGMSAWLMGTIWTNGYQRLLPHGTFMLDLGHNTKDGSPESVIVNLVPSANENPTTQEFLDTFEQWVHLAITFNSDEEQGDTLRIYSNGHLIAERSWDHGYIVPNTSWDFNLGYGNQMSHSLDISQPVYRSSTFKGSMDEFSWYSRALTEDEVQSIVSADSQGKAGMPHPPTCVPIGAVVTVHEQGCETNLFQAPLPDMTTEWQVGKAYLSTFECGENPVFDVTIDVTRGSVAFDQIAVTTKGIAFEPEVSLKEFEGENAQGDWRLLVQDTRVGAVEPTPVLWSWTLDLGYEPEMYDVIDLTEKNDYTYTGRIPTVEEVEEGQVPETVYFRVFVPDLAVAATNNLKADANLFMAGRWNGVPKFDLGIDDYLWTYTAPEQTNYVITTNVSSFTALKPGGRYYLALRNQIVNTNSTEYTIKVDFAEKLVDPLEGVALLTNSVPVEVKPEQGTNAVDYYQIFVGEEYVAASFTVYDATDSVKMVLSKGIPLPTDKEHAYAASTGTIGYAEVMIYTNSMPVALSAGDWFVGVYNEQYDAASDSNSVGYKVMTTLYTAETLPSKEDLFSGRPVSKTLKPGETHYYSYTVSDRATSLRTEFSHASEDCSLNLYTKFGMPLPSVANSPYLHTVTIDHPLDWILTKTNDVPLRAGSWFYAVENTNAFEVDYDLRATEFSIDFSEITWLTNMVACTNDVGLVPDGMTCAYYGFDVTTNGVGALFETFAATNGTVKFYTSAGEIPDPAMFTYSYVSETGNTNEYTRVSAWNGGLTPGYWFLTVVADVVDNPESASLVGYQIMATEFTKPATAEISVLTNRVPLPSLGVSPYREVYYSYMTGISPTNLIFRVSDITDGGWLVCYLLKDSPANGAAEAVLWDGGYYPMSEIVFNLNTDEESWVKAEPGTWYLVVENKSLFPVAFAVTAIEEGSPAPVKPICVHISQDVGDIDHITLSATDAKPGVRYMLEESADCKHWSDGRECVADTDGNIAPLTLDITDVKKFWRLKELE